MNTNINDDQELPGNTNCAVLARRYSTDAMIASAYSDYTESIVNNYSILLSLLSKAIDGGYTIQDLIDNNINTAAYLNLNRGEYQIHVLLSNIQQSCALDEDISDLERTPLVGGSEDTYLFVEDILDECNATFHAINADAAIAQSYKLSDSVADRITVARDYLAQKFSSAYTDFSGSLEYAISCMKESIHVSDWISKTMFNSGIDDVSDGIIENFEASNAYKYSGASPASAYCWDSVASVATSTVKIAAKVVKGVVGGILSIGKKLFSKAKKFVKEIVVDPYDLEKLSKEDNHTIDGYHVIVESNRPATGLGGRGQGLGALANKVKINEWYHTDWFCAESMSKITNIVSESVPSYAPNSSANTINNAWAHLGSILGMSFGSDNLANIKYLYTYVSGAEPQGTFEDASISIIEFITAVMLQVPLYWNQGVSLLYPDYKFGRIRDIASSLKSAISGMLPYLTKLTDNPDSYIAIDEALTQIQNNEFAALNNDYTSLFLWLLSSLFDVRYTTTELVRYKPVSYRFMADLSYDAELNGTAIWFRSTDIIRVFDNIVNDADPYADCTDPEAFLFNSFQFGKLCYDLLKNLLYKEALANVQTNESPSWIADPENYNVDTYLTYKISDGTSCVLLQYQYWGDPFIEHGSFINNFAIPTFPRSSIWTGHGLSPSAAFSYQFFCNIPFFVASTVKVSNAGFFNTAVGQYPRTSGYYPEVIKKLYSEAPDVNPADQNPVITIMDVTMVNLLFQWMYPFGYPFWPYSKSQVSWNEPAFRIKTDQDNISAFNKFVTTAVIVAAIAVVAPVTIRLLKRAAAKASLTQQGIGASCAQLASKGELDSKSLTKYMKSVKKANRMNKLVGNLNTVKSSTSIPLLSFTNDTSEATSSTSTDVKDIIRLINGV